MPDWDTGDVNDVAQAVQRSGHPNGYARHVENARRILDMSKAITELQSQA